MTFTRRRLLIVVPAVLALAGVVWLLVFINGPDLRTRSANIPVGMPRDQVEALLGKPVLTMERGKKRGMLLVWVDQYWQLDINLDPEGRTETVATVPSDSAYHEIRRKLIGLFK